MKPITFLCKRYNSKYFYRKVKIMKVKSKKEWPFRRLSISIVLLMALLLTGCPEKLKNLESMGKEAERELTDIERESKSLLAKIDKLRQYENERPQPRQAIKNLQREIISEQKLLDKKRDEFGKKLEEIVKAYKELNEIEIADAFRYIERNLPKLFEYLNPKQKTLKELMDALSNATGKLDDLKQLVDSEVNTVNTLLAAHNGKVRKMLRIQLAGLLAEHSAISFDDEIEAAGRIAAEINAVGPFPVVARTVVPQTTFFIQEGLPLGLEHLDNGILAPGTEIRIQLPPDWMLTSQATIQSDNLMLEVSGNEMGSSFILINVTGECISGKKDDIIWVTLNDVLIGKSGFTQGVLSVIPGQTSTQEFFVLPGQ